MTKSALITGNSSGMGEALTHAYLKQGYQVYGMSRRGCSIQHAELHDIQCNLAELEDIEHGLSTLLADCRHLDYVYLNAGVLGQIQAISDADMAELEELMRINLWSNKVILDWLLKAEIQCNTIIAISSGAAVNGNRGWAGYALSKAALNMLMQLYAHEWPDSKLIALAPGLVDTAMQDYLKDEEQVSVAEFPSVQRLRDAHGTAGMQTTAEAADKIYQLSKKLDGIESGSFIDIRNIS